MPVTSPEILCYLKAPEGACFEFKEAKGGFHFEKLVEYVVALANAGGGKIILGVTDRRPRQIVGTQAFPEPGRTEAGLFDRLGHHVSIEECLHEGHRLLIVHVPAREPGSVWEDRGVAWSRAGDALVPLTNNQRFLIFLEAAPDFSAQLCPDATLADLDLGAIANFRCRWAVKAKSDRILSLSDERLLVDTELMADGKLTYAALILFGTRSALGKHLARSEVVFEYRSNDLPGPAQDRQEYREGFLLFHDAIWNQINLRNDNQSYQDRFFRIDVPTFDEEVAREAILNAVCHREYRLEGSVFVRQYSRRIEIISPGGFPNGITVHNILDEQRPRNRRLADAFARCGLVERAGQGMDLIFERTIRHSKPLPDFERSGPNTVFLTLQGTLTDEAFIRFVEKVAAHKRIQFDARDLLVLDLVRRRELVPSGLRSRLEFLRGRGVVEAVGRGRGTVYMLSRAFYAQLNESGSYVHPQLDRDRVKALLLKHITESGIRGVTIDELEQIAPSLSRRHLQRLLAELRAANQIRMHGSRRGSSWHPPTA